jgi:hypothetical protein
VIVPLHEDWHLGVEAANVLVQEIVFVCGTKLIERLGDLGLLGMVVFFQTLPSGSFTSEGIRPSA